MSNHNPSRTDASKTSPALLFVAILSGAQFIAGGAALVEFVPAPVVALIVLILGGIQLAGSIVLKGQVTPWADVAAKRTPDGRLVSGPAAPPEVVQEWSLERVDTPSHRAR